MQPTNISENISFSNKCAFTRYTAKSVKKSADQQAIACDNSAPSIYIPLVQSWWQNGVRFGDPNFDVICTKYVNMCAICKYVRNM